MLNLETTVAVTQNFVNKTNFEFVCLDLAPGYQHKGVCRAGLLALDESQFQTEDNPNNSDLSRKEKRVKTNETLDDMSDLEFSYDINFLTMFLDKERDHYNSLWSLGNCIGQREMREWLWKLWLEKTELRNLIWKVYLFGFSL